MSLDRSDAPDMEQGSEGRLWTWSPLTETKRVYLAPGQLQASADAIQVSTILGSCVAVCLWDGEARVGGMNHFLLPRGAARSPRFAEHALPMLVAEVLRLGAQRPRLQAKLFGGASVLEAFRDSRPLGASNVEAAREGLAAESVRIVAEDVGGEFGRKVLFDVQTGSAWVRVITVQG